MSGIRKFARSLCKRLRDNGGAGATPPRKCALTFRIDSGYFEDSRIPFHGPCKAPLQETRGFRIFRRFRQSFMLSACAVLWSTLAGSWHGDFVRASNLDRCGSTCPSPALELPSAFAASVLARMQKADRTRRLPSPVRASITGPIPAKARRLGGDAAELSGAPEEKASGKGLSVGMLILAFMAGGLVFSMLMPRTVPPPVTPPAVISAPQAPAQPIRAKRRRAGGSKRASAPGVRHR